MGSLFLHPWHRQSSGGHPYTLKIRVIRQPYLITRLSAGLACVSAPFFRHFCQTMEHKKIRINHTATVQLSSNPTPSAKCRVPSAECRVRRSWQLAHNWIYPVKSTYQTWIATRIATYFELAPPCGCLFPILLFTSSHDAIQTNRCSTSPSPSSWLL